MKRVVGISLGARAQDFAFDARFLGRQNRVFAPGHQPQQ